MGRTLDEVLAALPVGRRASIERRADDLRERADALAELSRALEATSTVLGGEQTLAERSVRFLSELRNVIEAGGGRLQASIELPGRPTLDLSDLAEAASWRPLDRPERAAG